MLNPTRIFSPPLPTASPAIDLLTWKSRLLAAQTRYLGLVGSSVQIDILHLEGAAGEEAILRVPQVDAVTITSAIGDWTADVEGRGVGFRVVRSSGFVQGVLGRGEEDLYE